MTACGCEHACTCKATEGAHTLSHPTETGTCGGASRPRELWPEPQRESTPADASQFTRSSASSQASAEARPDVQRSGASWPLAFYASAPPHVPSCGRSCTPSPGSPSCGQRKHRACNRGCSALLRSGSMPSPAPPVHAPLQQVITTYLKGKDDRSPRLMNGAISKRCKHALQSCSHPPSALSHKCKVQSDLHFDAIQLQHN